MNTTVAFVMSVKLAGTEIDLRNFRKAVETIRNQTDKDWSLIMVDDY